MRVLLLPVIRWRCLLHYSTKFCIPLLFLHSFFVTRIFIAHTFLNLEPVVIYYNRDNDINIQKQMLYLKSEMIKY